MIGGCGFLGHHIVDLLFESYKCSISVIDLRTTRNRRPESDKVQYFDADITSLSSLLPIFEKVKPHIVIHTASPAAIGESSESKTKLRNAMYKKVNVDGTQCVIEACQKTGVKGLVYTSSASVISDTEADLINADERWPVIPAKNQLEYYSTTKVCSFRQSYSHQFKSANIRLPGNRRSQRPRREPGRCITLLIDMRHPPSSHLRRRRHAIDPRHTGRLYGQQNRVPARR